MRTKTRRARVVRLWAGLVTLVAATVGVAVNSAGAAGSNTLTVIDTTAAPAVAFTIATGKIPDAVALSPDQKTVVVSNEGDNTVSIFHVNQAPASTVRGAQTASHHATASGHDGAVRGGAGEGR